MSKKVTKQTPKPKGFIIQKINITPNYRRTQDIGSWRNAIRAAEAKNPRRIDLYDLYEDILLDGRLSAVIDKRKRTIKNSVWTFQNNNKVDETITKLISQPWFYNFLGDLLDTLFWGHSAFEFNFLADQVFYELIPRKHVEPISGIVSKEQFILGGIRYRDTPYNKYVIEAGDKPYMGLLMKAAQYVIYKRGGFGDWAQFAEIFGMPFRVGTYDGYDEHARIKLEEGLKEMGGASHVVIPEGTNIEFIETNNTASNSSLFDQLINACNREISTIFLGNTLTTEQGEKGARSLGEIHLEIEETVYLSDVLFVTMALNNQFKELLASHGYDVGDGEFVRMESQELDLNKRIEIDLKLKTDIKLPISDNYFYETYNIPKPDNYDELKEEIKQERLFFQQPAFYNDASKTSSYPVIKSKTASRSLKSFAKYISDFFS